MNHWKISNSSIGSTTLFHRSCMKKMFYHNFQWSIFTKSWIFDRAILLKSFCDLSAASKLTVVLQNTWSWKCKQTTCLLYSCQPHKTDKTDLTSLNKSFSNHAKQLCWPTRHGLAVSPKSQDHTEHCSELWPDSVILHFI